MKDASKNRRSMGRLGIFAAAAIILPLTATIVPAVTAHDEAAAPADAATPKIVKKVKIIRIDKDGKTVDVVGHHGDGKEVTKVERDGKTFVFHTNKKLSEEEVEDMIADAEDSRADAEDALADATEARVEAEVMREHAGEARVHAEAARVHAMSMAAAYIPEIDIKEITKNCKEGQPVTTDVSGFDGQNKSRIKIVMCGKGQAKLARVEALNGLREARAEIAAEEDMPKSVRKDVLEKLEEQIRKLEAETDKAG